MKRLIKIEFRKLYRHRAYWFMTVAYTVILAIMIFGIPELIDYIAEKTGERTTTRIFKAVVFNFPDVWQNIAFVAGMRYFIKIILGIIIIILITNEFNYQTIRLNVVNGLSRGGFLGAKVITVAGMTLFSTVVIFLSGLYLGLVHSVHTSPADIFGKTVFLGAYFVETFTFLLFCMLIGFVFRKMGVAFIVLFVYMIIEPIFDYKLPDAASPYLPLNAMNRLVQSPNTSLIKVSSSEFPFEFQERIALADTAICLLYAALFISICFLIIRKRDL